MKRDYTDDKIKVIIMASVMLLFCSLVRGGELPQRIISLAPANTEILYALNLGDKIVGVTTYCNYPPQAATREKVGDFSHPNLEKIASLNPDLILATDLEQMPTVTALRQLGYNVVVVDPQNFNQLFDSISLIGELTGTKTYAFNLNQSLQARISKVMRNISAVNRPRVKIFIEISVNPLMTAARDTFLDEMTNMLQAENIAHDLPRAYSRVSEEFVIARDPDYLVLTSPQARKYFTDNPVWQRTTAVARQQIIDEINPDILMRPGPRLVDGLEQLAERIYKIPPR